MSRKCRKTYNFQIGIYFRTIVHDFQCFTVQGGAFINMKPFCVHIGEKAGKGIPDHLVQRQLFQCSQGFIPISKDPVHCLFFFIKYHFYIRKCKRETITYFIIFAIFFRGQRQLFFTDLCNHKLLFFLQFFSESLFLSLCIADFLSIRQ